MGFYGNITNVNKSTFQFDKIYPNRKEMDDACAGDGVFIGRYVLVDYNEDSILGYVHAQIEDENLKNKPVVVGYQEKRYNPDTNEYEILTDRFYSGIPEVTEDKSAVKKDRLYEIGESTGGISIAEDTLLLCLGYVKTRYTIDVNPTTGDEVLTWIVEDGIENNGYDPQIYVAKSDPESSFVWLKDIDDIWSENKGRFIINHQIDATFYGKSIGRGWDSTVWQKTYKDGQATYIMVAELNSVVPTFDIVVDPPTPVPQKPYYDSDSSTVYYKLHLQPSWGLRIKAAENGISDEKGAYYMHNNAAPQERDLAIYWFKKGFHKYVDEEPETTQNSIKLVPTGYSGNSYYDKTDVFGKTAIDTYELSMMLPSIGEAISKLWDVVYGEGTYKDILGNRLWNKAALDFNKGEDSDFVVAHEPEDENDDDIKIRNTNLEWNTRNGIRAYWKYGSEENPELTYNKTAYNTLAGTINSVHDLVGMIIIENDNLFELDEHNQRKINPKNVDPSNIYYDKTTGKYYRKGKKYKFDSNELVGIFGSDMFNPKDGSHYHLESYPYDNYDNIYQANKESDNPIYEQVINNYYKVKQGDEIFEDEVYGTINNVTLVDNFNIANFDSSATIPANYLWWFDNVNGGEYTHEVKNKPRNKPYYKLAVTQVIDKPVFYSPGIYYLMKQSFQTLEERQAWDNTNVRNNIDFSYFGIMNEDSLANSLILNGIDLTDENRLIGYKILKGVTVDPARSDYILVDVNRRQNEECLADDENIVETEGDILVYRWNGFEAILQSKDDIIKTVEIDGENVNVLYYQYDITVFKSKSHSSLGSKTLKEWKDYIAANQELNEKDFKDLVRDESFVRKITDPFYTLANAVDIKNDIDDVGLDGYIDYYFLYPEEDSNAEHEYQRYYKRIQSPNSVQAQSLPWYELTPTLIPVYYDLSGEYYINSGNDYLRETASLLLSEDSDIENLEYYTVNFVPETKTPFIPNLYYYLDNGEYKLAETFDVSKTYYRYIDKYVTNDPNGVYDLGARWNAEVDPRVDIENNNDDITIKGKTFEWEFQEIPYFAKDVNTLHGLILKINQMLLAGDKTTRDNSTVQGCINLINDILDKFDQLKPAEIVMVDKLGQIHSGDWDTKQKSSTQQGTAPAIPAGEPAAADDERWIRLSTTAGTSPDFKPHIKLEHMFKAGTDTTSASNLNTDNVASNSDSDKMQLYTPILDNMGHVVAKNIETVTLPYGFKTVSIGFESSVVANLTHAAADLVAENTQDKLTINPGNKWMKLAGTANNDSFSIGHLVQTIDTARAADSDINGNGDTITIQDISNDEAGHITANKLHTYTLPYGFKTITGNNGSLVADNTQDTAAFSGDTWIQTTASSNGVAFTHIGPAEVTARQDVTNLTPSFGQSFSIEDWRFDEKGHKAGLQTHTVTLPQPANALLVGYEQASSIGSMPVATDDIKTAFAKLSYVLDNNTTPVDTRLNNLGNKTLVSSGISIMSPSGVNTGTVSRTFAQWAQLAEDIKYQIENWYESVSFAAWPIGSIYMAIDDEDPYDKFGIGEWEKIAEGQFLISSGENFETGDTGGSAQIAGNQVPPNTRVDSIYIGTAAVSSGSGLTALTGTSTNQNHKITASTESQTDYYPPYVAVSMWKRIA